MLSKKSRWRLSWAIWGGFLLLAAFVSIGETQPRPATLTPRVSRGAPGTSFRIDVNPVIGLDAERAAETRIVLRPPQAQGPQADYVLRIAEFHGAWLQVRIPSQAPLDLGPRRLLWLDRSGDVLASSGDRLFRIASAPPEAAQRPGGGVDPNPKRDPVPSRVDLSTPGIRGEARETPVPQAAPGGISAQAKRLPTPVVDYVTIGQNEIDMKSRVNYTMVFVLPTDVRLDDRVVLTFMVNARAGDVVNSLSIRINGSEVRNYEFNHSGTRAMSVTFHARILHTGRNEIVLYGTGGLRLKVGEIVLWFHRDIAW